MNTPTRSRAIALGLALSFASTSLPALAAVSARIDRDAVSEGDTVQLTLTRDDRGGGNPDLSPLRQDFDVLGTSRNTSVQFVNGSMSSQQQVQVSLSPKRTGHLQIPALHWGGDATKPVEVEVVSGGTAPAASGAAPADAGDGAHVFLTTALDPPRPYVQGAATLTVTLHTDLPLQNASLELAGNADVAVQQIGKDRNRTEVRDGHRYQLVERSYQLTPLHSGALTLPGATLEAQVPDRRGRDPFDDDDLFSRAFGNSPFAGMAGGLRPLRLHAKDVVIDARPRPASVTGPDWLPAQNVTVDARWQPESGPVHAGEPLNLHLRIVAKGLSAAQLPDLAARLQLPEGLKAYPDPPKFDTATDEGGVTGIREQDIALMADMAGHYAVPALRLQWWDTAADAARELTVPAHEITVAAGAAAAGVTPPPVLADAAPPVSSSPASTPAQPALLGNVAAAAPSSRPWWLPLIAVLLLLWLATLALWWRERRRARRPPAPSAPVASAPAPSTGNAAALRRLKDACKTDDAAAAREALLDWGRSRWPEAPPNGLTALASRFDDARLKALLSALDRAVYTGTPWQGAALLAAFDPGRPPSAAPASRRPPTLGALYDH